MRVSKEQILDLMQKALSNNTDEEFGRTMARVMLLCGIAVTEGHTSELYLAKVMLEEVKYLSEILGVDFGG